MNGVDRATGLAASVNRLTPVAEVAWSSAAGQPNRDATQFLFAVGIAYAEDEYAIGVEALFTGNRETGWHAGLVAQVHLYFDDLFPGSPGKPVLDG